MFDRQGVSATPCIQRDAVDVLHHKAGSVDRRAGIDRSRDVGMFECREDPAPGCDLRVVGAALEQFQCSPSTHGFEFTFVDRPDPFPESPMNVADRPETQVMPVDGGDASDLDRDRRGLAAVGETCDRSGATCQASALPPRGDHDDGSADDPPARQEIEAACAKVLSSRTFLHSARHRAFLRFVVQAALEGRAECLTEVAIGREIFGCVLNGRDAGRDPIVRVEARRLRLKLQRYYENEGRDDVLQIGLPGRTYAPTFQTRRRGAGPADGEALVLVLPFVVYGVEAARSTISIGLANQLIDLFESRPGIRVAASIIATELCERSVPFDTLRGVHGIDYVIDGSIITEGSRMRCVAHLSRTRDGRRLWSSRFDTPRAGSVASGPAASDDAGPLAFQDRIAMQVVAAVVRECGTA